MKNTYFKADISDNPYAKEWGSIEAKKSVPSVFRKLIHIEYKEFISKILQKDPNFVKNIVENLYAGDMYIIKNSLSKNRVDHIINEIHKFTQASPSKFYKMFLSSCCNLISSLCITILFNSKLLHIQYFF